MQKTIPQLIDSLKPKLSCETIAPKWMKVGVTGQLSILQIENENGGVSYVAPAESEEQREFLTQVLETADHKAVCGRAFNETSWVVLLVRDRLERGEAR